MFIQKNHCDTNSDLCNLFKKWPLAEIQHPFPAEFLKRHLTDEVRVIPRQVLNVATEEMDTLTIIAKVETGMKVFISIAIVLLLCS